MFAAVLCYESGLPPFVNQMHVPFVYMYTYNNICDAVHFSFPGPILNKNMPTVAGILKWSQELRDRVNTSVDKLKSLDKGY